MDLFPIRAALQYFRQRVGSAAAKAFFPKHSRSRPGRQIRVPVLNRNRCQAEIHIRPSSDFRHFIFYSFQIMVIHHLDK